MLAITGLFFSLFTVLWGTTAAASAPAEACLRIEASFKDHLLGKLDSATENFKVASSCLKNNDPACESSPLTLPQRADISALSAELNAKAGRQASCEDIGKKHLEIVKTHRSLYRKLAQEVATDWMNQRNRLNGGLTHSCFKNSSHQAELETHARNLKVQADDRLMCLGDLGNWTEVRDRMITDRLNGKTPSSSLTAEELKTLKAIRELPWLSRLGDNTLYLSDLSDEAVKQDLAEAFTRISNGMGKLRESIQGLEAKSLHQLYNYKSQWNLFKSGLSGPEKAQADACHQQSGFLQSCFGKNGIQGRCNAKALNLARDFLPLIPIFDGIKEYNTAGLAHMAGILSNDERVAQQTAAGQKVVSTALGSALGVAPARQVARAAEQLPQGLTLSNPRFAMSSSERLAMLRRNGALSLPERLEEAERIIGRQLTPAQRKAVEEAHAIGEGKKHFEYSIGELRAKVKKLKDAGFSEAEAFSLQRHGITGQASSGTDTVSDVLTKAGVPEDVVQKYGYDSLRRSMSDIPSHEAQALSDTLVNHGSQAALSGRLDEANNVYKTVYDINVDVARTAAAGGRDGVASAYVIRSFAYKNAWTSSVQDMPPAHDGLVRMAAQTGYFSKIETKGFQRLYDPKLVKKPDAVDPTSVNNLNVYSPEVIAQKEVQPTQVYLANNRQLQELFALKRLKDEARMAPSGRSKVFPLGTPVPSYLKDIPDNKLTEYINLYQNNMRVIENTYFKKP